MEIITVKAGPKAAPGRVVLWERHPDHPEGEVFVAGDAEVQAARTPTVEDYLTAGRLMLVEKPARAAKE